jgi:hypothetical protein
MDADPDDLIKIHVDLSDQGESGEAMWAKPLGDDCYELRNSPFYAYTLNFLDIVRAKAPSPNLKPEFVEIVRRSGHRTVWVTFTDEAPAAARQTRLELLNKHRAFYEGANGTYFAIDIEPDGNLDATVAQLTAWQSEGVLEFRGPEPH